MQRKRIDTVESSYTYIVLVLVVLLMLNAVEIVEIFVLAEIFY